MTDMFITTSAAVAVAVAVDVGVDPNPGMGNPWPDKLRSRNQSIVTDLPIETIGIRFDSPQCEFQTSSATLSCLVFYLSHSAGRQVGSHIFIVHVLCYDGAELECLRKKQRQSPLPFRKRV